MQDVTYKKIEDVLLEDHADKFEDKRFLFGLFGSIVKKTTQEKVIYSYRYFQCDAAELISHVQDLNFEGIASLPYAYDENNEVGTSSVCLDLRYLKSGEMVAVQVQQYIDSCPTMTTEAKILFENDSKSVIDIIKNNIDFTSEE
ncbi:hypothetical protein [uncultured Pseudoteredinibacter sp.]|uniref:hypothetical protein n=1 Tax=uncultured Pseudoteredinibacter sp. TaxID=1641701 RepID=UPI00260B52E6|nr:hypothetical protein [uncultured Pseudoteredinibacter sp.]